jgi:hypothetical protein
MMLRATTAKVVEPVPEPVLDLVDGFLLDRLTKGWTPHLFLTNCENSNFHFSQKQ